MAEALTQNIGPYQLVRLLAQGGMAEIWLARHPQHGEVVVKRVHPHLTSNSEFLMMFVDEARIAARLNHPGCVQIFDLGKEGSTYYIAMEYIDGEDIRSIARQARTTQIPLPRKLAVAIIMGACEGLHYAHELLDANGRPLNVVHRDVSPQNILVTFDGQVRIVDFGIAKAADQANRTRSGVLKGKYAYMAPEQILGVPLDRRADVFALGVLLYELTTGRRLFKAKTELETMRRITQNIFTKPTAASPGYPPDLETIVLKAVSNDRIARYGTALELRADLERFLGAHRVTVTAGDLAELMKKVFSGRLEAIAAARQSGNPGAILDARFGDDSSESSGQGLAPDEASLSVNTTGESTAVEEEPPSSRDQDFPDVRTDRALPVPPGPAPRPAPVPMPQEASGPVEEDLAPTRSAPPVPELVALSAAEGTGKVTETAMPAVHLEDAGSAQHPTAPSMAAVWMPPGPVSDARLAAVPEEPLESTSTELQPDPDDSAWFDQELAEDPTRADVFDEEVPGGSNLFAWIVGVVLLAAAGVGGLFWLMNEPAAEATAMAGLSVALQSTPAGADIHLDSLRLRQKTPTVLTNLEPGVSYEVQLSFPTGESWKQTFKPEDVPGKPPTLVHTFPGMELPPEQELAAAEPVEPIPAEDGFLSLKGVGVAFIDGERAGKLPLRRFALSPGPHKVEVRRGKRRNRFEVEIVSGETLVRKATSRRPRRRR